MESNCYKLLTEFLEKYGDSLNQEEISYLKKSISSIENMKIKSIEQKDILVSKFLKKFLRNKNEIEMAQAHKNENPDSVEKEEGDINKIQNPNETIKNNSKSRGKSIISNKTFSCVFGIILGLIIGFIISYSLHERYEIVNTGKMLNSTPIKIDKLTGKTWILDYSKNSYYPRWRKLN